MEIRELAERALFGARLEDKLTAPGELTDRSPGSAIEVPAAPARPEGLAFV
ncbi:MAG: hypothetical protein IIC23_14215, partial [Chloroflexi bacterium]|nr:hypothetical protein [Chloroflexota bacterium]